MPRTIRLLALDVDGVLTDGRVYFGARGEALKAFHVHDGYGIKQLQSAGVTVAVITARRSPPLVARCRELGVRHIHQGVSDKLAVLKRLCARLGVSLGECAAVGDDLPDLAVLRAVALPFTVANAHPSVRRAIRRVTRLPGGAGAVREVCDALLASGRGAPRRARLQRSGK